MRRLVLLPSTGALVGTGVGILVVVGIRAGIGAIAGGLGALYT